MWAHVAGGDGEQVTWVAWAEQMTGVVWHEDEWVYMLKWRDILLCDVVLQLQGPVEVLGLLLAL